MDAPTAWLSDFGNSSGPLAFSWVQASRSMEPAGLASRRKTRVSEEIRSLDFTAINASSILKADKQDILNKRESLIEARLIGEQREEAYEKLDCHRWDGGGSRRRNSLTCVVCRGPNRRGHLHEGYRPDPTAELPAMSPA